jgi:hypothetical protein
VYDDVTYVYDDVRYVYDDVTYVYDDVRYVYDDVTYVYDDVTYVYDDVTYVYDDVTYVYKLVLVALVQVTCKDTARYYSSAVVLHMSHHHTTLNSRPCLNPKHETLTPVP